MPGDYWVEARPTYNAGVIRRLRRFYRLALLGLHLLTGVLSALIFPLLGPARRDRVVGAWSARLLRVMGLRAHFATPPDCPQGAMLVCNHVSWLDIYVILAARHVHFVSKSEVRAWPVLGWLAARAGTLFVERGRRTDTRRINDEMRSLMQAGRWVALFPEGTTSDGRGLRRFLSSLLQPAIDLGCPVVPAALRYTTADGKLSTDAAYIDNLSLLQSAIRILDADGLVAELRFGAPLPVAVSRRDLAVRAEDAVAGLLGIARAPEGAFSQPGPRLVGPGVELEDRQAGTSGDPPVASLSAPPPTNSRCPAPPDRGD